MSLSPIIDEIRLVVNKIAPEIAVFTETWLRQAIPNSVVNIPGYNITKINREWLNYETRDQVTEGHLEESYRQLIGHVWILLTLARKS